MYARLLTLGLIDSVITLPITITELVVSLLRSGNDIQFWPGLGIAHTNVTLVNTLTTEEWKSEGLWSVVEIRFSQRSCPFTAIVFFALFGFTEHKRSQYRNFFCKIMKPFGFIPRANPVASIIQFRSEFTIPGTNSTREMTV